MNARPAIRQSRSARWVKRALLLCVMLALAPIPCILALGLVNPPITMVMLARVASRVANGERPFWPAHAPIARSGFAPALRRAVLASEDDRFYLHSGIDFVEIEKALERRRRGGRLRGASTLTQQVVKNIFLWNGRSFVRKGLEAYLALTMDALLSKERILDLYLNLAEWGPNAFGAEAGARAQFGKSARALTGEEAARMAAILPAPRRWPANGRIAGNRAVTILARMQYPAPKVMPPSSAPRPRPAARRM